MIPDFCKSQMDALISSVEFILKYIKDNNLQNEQEVLNWLDKLNKLSVMY